MMNNQYTIIIGGGLSGLTCGIALAKRGYKVTILASGQSTLLFNGGSMELLGCIDGEIITSPLEAINRLPEQHPYRKIGTDRIETFANQAKDLLDDAGIVMEGQAARNHWRISPMGVAMPAWLTLNGNLWLDSLEELPARRLALMCVRGYLDQPNSMLAHGLQELGFDVRMKEFTTDDITSLRRSPSEMRAPTLAKRLLSSHALQRVADQVNQLADDADIVLLPSVFGQQDDSAVTTLQAMVNKPLRFVATLPPSVSGMRIQSQLLHYFKMLGGDYRMGETAASGTIEDERVVSIKTNKSGATPLKADRFVLATGSFITRGLVADSQRIYEPIFDLDTDADEDREKWTQYNVLEPQAYWTYGIATDERLRCRKQGKTIMNLHGIGSVLSGHNAIKMGDGSGVSLLSALAVAQDIISGK